MSSCEIECYITIWEIAEWFNCTAVCTGGVQQFPEMDTDRIGWIGSDGVVGCFWSIGKFKKPTSKTTIHSVSQMKKTLLFAFAVLSLLLCGCSQRDDGSRLPGKWEIFKITDGRTGKPSDWLKDEEIIGGTFHFHTDGSAEISDTTSKYQSLPRWEFTKEPNSIRLSAVEETGESVVKECKIEFISDSVYKMYSPRFHPPFAYLLRKVEWRNWSMDEIVGTIQPGAVEYFFSRRAKEFLWRRGDSPDTRYFQYEIPGTPLA